MGDNGQRRYERTKADRDKDGTIYRCCARCRSWKILAKQFGLTSKGQRNSTCLKCSGAKPKWDADRNLDSYGRERRKKVNSTLSALRGDDLIKCEKCGHEVQRRMLAAHLKDPKLCRV